MPKRIDLCGQTFSLLEVIEYTGYKIPLKGNNKRKYCYYMCKCKCGNKKEIMGLALTKNYTKSCGCLQSLSGTFHTCLDDKDITGKVFGKLTVIQRDFSNLGLNKHTRYFCKCECGNEKSIARHDIMKNTKSCGCLKKNGCMEDSKKNIV